MHSMAPLYYLLVTFCLLLPASPMTFKLQRALPSAHGNGTHYLSNLRAHDFDRHRRILPTVFPFPVYGNGIYYTKVPLGSPPKEFHVVIDTGSHVAWVSCGGCNSCPKTSSFPIQLNNFDPRSSSTSSAILCSDRLCRDGSHSHDAACDIGSNQCNFKVKYADGSGTSGHYFSDLMHFTGFAEGSVATDSSSRVVFGCSNLRTGGFAVIEEALDGILGLGNSDISVISQLSSQGVVPRVLSHCLKGDSSGGGTLVFGEVMEPSIVYSPFIPSQ